MVHRSGSWWLAEDVRLRRAPSSEHGKASRRSWRIDWPASGDALAAEPGWTARSRSGADGGPDSAGRWGSPAVIRCRSVADVLAEVVDKVPAAYRPTRMLQYPLQHHTQ